MGIVADVVVKQMANGLINDGYQALRAAYDTRQFTNRTFNLHDSYGSCLYYNGKEYPNSRRYVGRNALVGKKDMGKNLILGRAEIDAFFDKYKPNPKGFDLVVAVAIFYGEILEKGTGKLRRKYRVISGAANQIYTLASMYNGKVTKINL